MRYIDYECAGIQRFSQKFSQIDLRESILILAAFHKFLPLDTIATLLRNCKNFRDSVVPCTLTPMASVVDLTVKSSSDLDQGSNSQMAANRPNQPNDKMSVGPCETAKTYSKTYKNKDCLAFRLHFVICIRSSWPNEQI